MSAGAEVDLFVIGGGINGAGIARDAAGRGLAVALAEANDLAGATSSASSKLVHGGLRYLEHFAFRLVREALAEREALLRIAPHLVRPLRFVVPHQPALRSALAVRAGLMLYDHLGGRRSLPGSQAMDLIRDPAGRGLRPQWRRGFAYSDCLVDDARLVVATARDAAQRGAAILTRTRCTAARRDGQGWIVSVAPQRGGAVREWHARALVNAAGPWAGQVASEVVGEAAPPLRLVRGSHVVVPRLHAGEHALLLQGADRRVVFVIPFADRFSLIGTTEIPVAAPDDPAIAPDEIAYLQETTAQFLVRGFSAQDVVWSYSGIRPLYDDGAHDPSAVTRDYVLALATADGRAPLISVLGGKITTYRRLAERVLDKLAPWFPGLGAAWTAGAALPGGDLGPGGPEAGLAELAARRPLLPRPFLRRLVLRHGSETGALLGAARVPADLGRHFGGLLYEREVEHFRQHEWASSAADILWRRSKEGLEVTPAQAAALAAYLGDADPAAPGAPPEPPGAPFSIGGVSEI